MDFADFHGQFVLHAAAESPPLGWTTWASGRWRLSAHPGLPVARIVTGGGDAIGFALGHIVAPDARLLSGDLAWTLPSDHRAAEREIEARLFELNGRYAAILLHPRFSRVYLDAGGTLAAVFCPRRRRVASTTALVAFDEEPNPVLARDPEAFPADKGNQFFPAGLTGDPETMRLLPNHYLDLADWTPARWYPKQKILPAGRAEIARSIRSVHALIRRQIEAAVRSHERVYLSLTSGRDSRLMLACARDFIDKIDFVTFLGGSRRDTKLLDESIPPLLASRFGLRHTAVDATKPPPREVYRAYQLRTGLDLNPNKARDFDAACRKHLDLSGAWLSGFAGGAIRAFYWKETPPPRGPLTAADLLNRMQVREHAEFLEPLDRWIAGLPPGDSVFHLDLANIEHRIGAWASPHLYGGAPFRMKLFPLCTHEGYDIMLRLPPTYRYRNGLARDIIRMAWPELLSLPCNEYPGLKGWIRRASGAARRLAKKVRTLVAK